jgi:hypothetical protein
MEDKHRQHAINKKYVKKFIGTINNNADKKRARYFDEWWNEQNEGTNVVHKRGNCCDSQDSQRLRSESTKPLFRQPTPYVDSDSGEDDTLTKRDYFVLDLYQTQDYLADILLRKHNDYGSSNISDAPGGALNGLRVRLHDKISRLNNLSAQGTTPEYESVRDTFIDIANYATIAIMVLDGTWDD